MSKSLWLFNLFNRRGESALFFVQELIRRNAGLLEDRTKGALRHIAGMVGDGGISVSDYRTGRVGLLRLSAWASKSFLATSFQGVGCRSGDPPLISPEMGIIIPTILPNAVWERFFCLRKEKSLAAKPSSVLFALFFMKQIEAITPCGR